jgi:hypothetical protein
LAVGNGPDGPTAVAALRFELAAQETNPVLTLQVARRFSGQTVKLVACPATSPWFGVQAGKWPERPKSTCEAAVAGQSTDGATWAFALAPVARGPQVDVVIQPGPGASEPFEISFEAPTAGSLRTTPAAPAGDPRAPSEFQSSGGFAPPPDTPVPFSEPAVDSAFDGSALPGAGGEPSETAERSLPPRQPLLAAPASQPVPGQAADPRLLAILVLISGLVAAGTLWREPAPQPRRLGPIGSRSDHPPPLAGESRGLGRFRRERQGEPRSLR